ncbi:hypothetical protein [Stutzerimonas stutzeri]|jgi:hypothetical protein|uniref:Uncharacterized protein n=1 Tax=Stutzerimonas stutzeri TaxID=316 RepID=A0A172WRF7_STUST|nr:hypothetical protein [Stutzerimonas stutzeri]ANF26000.1 hypothetical protein PS273GM_13030 [Stutzerimonas stutzeri]
MKPEETIKQHFRLMRQASSQAFADYHANVLYGYLLGIRETGQISAAMFCRLHGIVQKAWGMKVDRIYGFRRAA